MEPETPWILLRLLEGALRAGLWLRETWWAPPLLLSLGCLLLLRAALRHWR